MSTPSHDLCVSIEEYLEFENSSQERHEYVAGRVFAMVGSTQAHNLIVSNLHGQIYDAVKKAGCRSYISDMKVNVESLQSFYYPDLVVSCEPVNPKAVYLSAPCLIVEVLSPSTKDVDRREKLVAYRQIGSLIEYVLVLQDKAQIEVYRKDDRGNWHCTVFTGDSKVPLKALGASTIELDMQDVYFGAGLSEK